MKQTHTAENCPSPSSTPNPKQGSAGPGAWLAMTAMAVAGLASSATTPAAAQSDSAAPTPHKDHAEAERQNKAAAPVVHSFAIAAGPLSEVIAALKQQTGLVFQLKSEKIGAITSPGVQGVLSADEALRAALKGTGVSARIGNDGSLHLELSSDQQSVEVVGTGMASPKFTTALVDLPQTITVIGQSTLQATASNSLQDALRTVPGITFGAGEGGNPIGDRPFIRGMDSQSSTYVDGMRDIGSQSREVFDVDSIEVSEGPGGAYGGRGTGGGSINMNSKLPRNERFLHGSFTPGTADYKRFTLDANSPIGKSVAARIAGLWHDAAVAGRDGVHNSRWGVAPSLAFGLGKPTRAYLDYYHMVTNSIPDGGVPYNNPSVVPTVDPGTRVLQKGDGSPLKLPHRNTFYGLLDRDHDRETAKIGTVRVEHDLWGERSLIRSSYRFERTGQDYVWTLPDDSKGNLYYGLVFRRPNDRVSSVYSSISQTDLSGQFKTGKVHHSYAAGMEFSQERGNNDAYTLNATSFGGGTEYCPNGAGAASGYNCTSLYSPNMHDPWTATGTMTLNHNPTRSKTVTKSGYGFDTVQFNKHLQSTLGLRYDNYSSSYQSAATAGVRTSYKTENNLVTYMASLVYKPDHATSVYGTVSTASIPTGNALAQGSDTSALTSQVNANLQPETIREEEIGAKRELRGGKALLRADLFREDIHNVRITQEDGSIAAAGVDRTLGAELGISGKLTRNWEFNGGYTYIDAVLVQAGGSGTANGLTNGNSMPNTPRHGVAVTSNYRILPKLRMGGGIYGMTKVWGSQSQNKWVPGYVREDIFGNYEFNKHLNLQLNIQNLSDKLYYDKAYPTHYASMAPGRTALFGLNASF